MIVATTHGFFWFEADRFETAVVRVRAWRAADIAAAFPEASVSDIDDRTVAGRYYRFEAKISRGDAAAFVTKEIVDLVYNSFRHQLSAEHRRMLDEMLLSFNTRF